MATSLLEKLISPQQTITSLILGQGGHSLGQLVVIFEGELSLTSELIL